ncbi:hypothetical protein [Ensifer sp. ZNC0028]|uniref:hypothetical protein n=1 Tax=unclassified Ensifer TaxID=2633371 RepID=UPI0009DEFBBA|nr:hypothetical protein [Ensifer sp. ZNC0028]
MAQLELSPEFYAECDEGASFREGEVFHRLVNARGGSLATPVARFFASRPRIAAEGFHKHTRLDCFINDRKLVPQPERLAERILAALIRNGSISEPIWLGWHRSEEIGGRAHGAVFDFD